MKIDSYAFGQIVIDGKKHIWDLIIHDNRVESSWWRREGHTLYPEDISGVLAEKPDILIIGTGYSGGMTVPKKTQEDISSRGITLRIGKTQEAVELFNTLQGGKQSVAAALHLTC